MSLDDFECGKPIGEGAFAKVYSGIHKATGIDVAVKLLFAQKLEEEDKVDFLRETSVMAQVSDLFVLPFLGWTATQPYAIITQLAPNGSLFNALRGKPGSPEMTPTLKTKLMIGIAKGMLALHKKKIIHRDLKSLNVLLDERCFPKICDFGLSIIDSEVAMKTREIGTPHWMAPELFETTDYTNKVDVYAYGVLMWEILTESTPYKGMSGNQIAVAVCQHGERPPFPRGTPKLIQQFIRECWHQIPSKRPSFKQIVNLLEKRTVVFPGTDMDELDFFFQQIKEDEELRKQGKGIGVRPLGNPLFIAKMTQGLDQGGQKSNEANPSELSNPLYNNYQQNFKLCIKLFTYPESIKQFFELLVPAVVNDPGSEITNFILTQCLKLVTKEDYIFNAFYSSKLFGSLTVNKKETSSAIFNLLNYFFSKRPEAIDGDMLSYYSPLTPFAPHKMLKLLMFNLERFGDFANGWEVSNMLMYISPTMIRSNVGDKYIRFIMKMLNHPQFKQQYIKSCIRIIIAAIQQENPETCNTAYAALIQLNDGSISISPDVITKSLTIDGCEKGALAYLLKTTNIRLNPTMIDRLFTLAEGSKEAFALILLFSQRPDSFTSFFPDYNAPWLVDGRLSLEHSVQVMAGIMCNKDYRRYVSAVSQVPKWLSLLAQSMKSSTIGFTTLMIAKIGITEDLLNKLNNVGFFKKFVEGFNLLKDDQLLQNTIVLIDGCSRIMNIEDFSALDPLLMRIALKDQTASRNNDRLYIGAISALSMRSLHKEGAIHLKSLPNIGTLITTYQNDPQARPFIEILWRNCTAV